MINIPQKIYLQIGEETPEADWNFKDLSEVTWEADKVFDTDIEYTLAQNTQTLEVQQIQDSYIKGYEAGEREWISVEDRLPGSGDYVDVFALKTYESGATKGRRYTEIEYYIDPVSKWADFIMPMPWLKITHWMPLPEPPKTKEL